MLQHEELRWCGDATETSSSAIAERPRCRVGCYGQKWKTGTGRQYLRTRPYIDLYSTTATYLEGKAIEIGQKRQIMAITPFKVIQGHRSRYQSKARM